MTVTSIPIIIAICYMIGEFIKLLCKKKSKCYRSIPIILGFIGGLIALIIYYNAQSVMGNCSNQYDALLVGIASGFASSGTNQIAKLIKNKRERKE